MDNIGQYIASLREEKQVTIEELAEKTLIKPKLIELLENNEITKLGGYGIAKSFTATLVKSLGGSSAKANSILDNNYPEYREQTIESIKYAPQKTILISTNFIYMILVVIAVVILSLISYNTYKNSDFNFFKERKIIVEEKEKIVEKAVIIELPPPSERD